MTAAESLQGRRLGIDYLVDGILMNIFCVIIFSEIILDAFPVAIHFETETFEQTQIV